MIQTLILFLSLTASAAWATCDDDLTAIRFLTEAVGPNLSAFGNSLIQRHADFRKWLRQEGEPWDGLSDARRYELLGQYYSQQLSSYTEIDGRGLQLDAELTYRGADTDTGLRGYPRLRALSAENYSRQIVRMVVMDFANVQGDFPAAQVTSVLNELELVYIHNTTGLFKRPVAPLLSSRELLAMGIDGKLNTKPFNTDILKSDGNVYFYAIPHVKSAPFPKVISPFGNVNLILNPLYAERWGWASPYVMNPSDLEGLRMPLRRLHEWDFKPSDLLKLIRMTFEVSLRKLWVNDRAEFDRVLAELKSGADLLPLMRKYSLGRLGIPFEQIHNSLELKIPIAVAPQALELRPTGDGYSPFIPSGPRLHRLEMP